MGALIDSIGGMLGLGSTDAEDTHQQNFGGQADMLQDYRWQTQEARQRALDKRMAAWNPVNEVLRRQYGDKAALDLSVYDQSPWRTGTEKEFATALQELADKSVGTLDTEGKSPITRPWSEKKAPITRPW